eukprot:5498073-Prymnesium_polylepis.1
MPLGRLKQRPIRFEPTVGNLHGALLEIGTIFWHHLHNRRTGCVMRHASEDVSITRADLAVPAVASNRNDRLGHNQRCAHVEVVACGEAGHGAAAQVR